MAKNIEYRDNTEEVLSALEAAIKRGNEAIGMAAERHAKKRITIARAVDTGRLRNSITYALAGEETHVKSYKANKGGKDREAYNVIESMLPQYWRINYATVKDENGNVLTY